MPDATTAGFTATAAEATGLAVSTSLREHALHNKHNVSKEYAEYLTISSGMILSPPHWHLKHSGWSKRAV